MIPEHHSGVITKYYDVMNNEGMINQMKKKNGYNMNMMKCVLLHFVTCAEFMIMKY